MAFFQLATFSQIGKGLGRFVGGARITNCAISLEDIRGKTTYFLRIKEKRTGTLTSLSSAITIATEQFLRTHIAHLFSSTENRVSSLPRSEFVAVCRPPHVSPLPPRPFPFLSLLCFALAQSIANRNKRVNKARDVKA